MTWTDRKVRESKLIRARGRDEACARLIKAQTRIQACGSTRRRLTQEVITCERDLMIGAPAIAKDYAVVVRDEWSFPKITGTEAEAIVKGDI
jgi:predicted nucleic acid-binding protein